MEIDWLVLETGWLDGWIDHTSGGGGGGGGGINPRPKPIAQNLGIPLRLEVSQSRLHT
jgi:hypothetical protein